MQRFPFQFSGQGQLKDLVEMEHQDVFKVTSSGETPSIPKPCPLSGWWPLRNTYDYIKSGSMKAPWLLPLWMSTGRRIGCFQLLSICQGRLSCSSRMGDTWKKSFRNPGTHCHHPLDKPWGMGVFGVPDFQAKSLYRSWRFKQSPVTYPVPAGEHSPSSQQVLSEVTWFPQFWCSDFFGAYGPMAAEPNLPDLGPPEVKPVLRHIKAPVGS